MTRGNRYILSVFYFLLVFILALSASSEWFFWQEFNTRFNFIAVDYLVYTTEVLGNIQQSYPVGLIVTGLLVFSLAATVYLHQRTNRGAVGVRDLNFKGRSVWMFSYIGLAIIVFFAVENRYHRFSANNYVNELAGNGMYELFSAYRHNELDYEQFYKTIPARESFEIVRNRLAAPGVTFLSSDPNDITRRISSTDPERRLNVVLISVESLSANFLASFGNNDHLTPNLDSIASQSLLFTNCYATGTRTVRGLEALSLSIPPTPRQSIVRRPNNENLFTLQKFSKTKAITPSLFMEGMVTSTT
jgi:phosphoglycerol transferase MdoB-like AlkP superfamily enzyme